MILFNKYLERSEGRIVQIAATISGTLNAISDGMHIGWTSPIVPKLLKPNSPIPITESNVTWLENMVMIGSICSIPVAIYLVNTFGRKRSILLGAFTSLISWTIIAFASSVYVLFAARFISGISGDVTFVTGPIYIAEISDHKIRGFLGSMEFIMMVIGITIVYIVGPHTTLVETSIVGSCCILLQFLTFSFMPESPYYYIIQGNEEKARKSLKILRWSDDVEEEFQKISQAIKRETAESGRFIDLFLIKSNRKAVIIMLFINVAQNFGAFTVILMNAQTILDHAATMLEPNIVSIIFAVTMLFACIVASAIVDKVGRKLLIISSSILTGIDLLCFAVYFHLKENGLDMKNYSWAPLALLVIYAFVYKYGLGMMPIVLIGELFSSSVKLMGMGFSDLSYMLSCIASIHLYQLLATHIAFYLFAASCIFTAFFTYFYIPETKGLTLEEIQLSLRGELKSKQPKANNDHVIKNNPLSNDNF